MPVSHEHRFIFIHIPKAAGTSIEQALARFTSLELLKSRILTDNEVRERGLSAIARLHRNELHLSALDVQLCVGREKFERYFKFAFVRNPFDRLVSFYQFAMRVREGDRTKLQVRLAQAAADFEDFVMKAIAEPAMLPFFNQHLYLNDDRGRSCVDFIGRFETLDQDFQRVVRRAKLFSPMRRLVARVLGRPLIRIPHVNVSGPKRDFRNHYSAALRQIVQEACATDLELYGYSFSGLARFQGAAGSRSESRQCHQGID